MANPKSQEIESRTIAVLVDNEVQPGNSPTPEPEDS